jgi:hypothetical protein
MDKGKPYGRLRMDHATAGKKYHQRHGTGVHAYLTPSVYYAPKGQTIVIVEGEKKALALSELSIPAIGISGFFGFEILVDAEREWVPEIIHAFDLLQPTRILFLGDTDTSLNAEFSLAACRLAKRAPCPVYLPRIPLDSPKGIDDCKAVMDGKFSSFWNGIEANAVQLSKEDRVEKLAMLLFRREHDKIISHPKRDWIQDRLIKFAAAFLDSAISLDEITEVAASIGMKKGTFARAVRQESRKGQQAELPEQVEAYYLPPKKSFYVRDTADKFIEIVGSDMLVHLAKKGYSRSTENTPTSRAEDERIKIQTQNNVSYAGPLAGYNAGFYTICDYRVLVTQSPRFKTPKPGDWSIIKAFLEGLFSDPDSPELDQLSHFYGWLKLSYISLSTAKHAQAQAVALAGPPGAGKSLLQGLIAECLGGRVAKPYRYMSGRTEFNMDLFWAENLMMEDETPCTDISSRRAFGARIKEITVNRIHSCHGKGLTAVSLTPLWRLTVSVNDEPENLMILPPIDDSIADKLMLFRVVKSPFPMPMESAEERTAFVATLSRQIPAFLHYLTTWDIPEQIRCKRFGVLHFHHPAILEALTEMAPETRLLGLIDLMLDNREAGDGGPFIGSATELKGQLVTNEHTRHDAQDLLKNSASTGSLLSRLLKAHPKRIKFRRTTGHKTWTVYPIDWEAADEKSSLGGEIE